MEDKTLLHSVPDYISVGGLLKATPLEESGKRLLFLEASNEDVDHQNEIVLQKALAESADYYLRHGNLDLSHYSLIGPKAGIANFMEYEIGKPIAVTVDGKRTFVKAELYQGDSPMAKNAEMVWDSLTKQKPASRWYPSVGGAVLAKSVQIDPITGDKVAVIEKVRWNNIALDRCPVNRSVPEVSTVPVGVFAKSFNGFIMKTLEAGYGTDASALAAGGALRVQSLEGSPLSYLDYRDRFAALLRSRRVGNKSGDMVKVAQEYLGLPAYAAKRFVKQFINDINSRLKV
jgi:hypothetical protein